MDMLRTRDTQPKNQMAMGAEERTGKATHYQGGGSTAEGDRSRDWPEHMLVQVLIALTNLCSHRNTHWVHLPK